MPHLLLECQIGECAKCQRYYYSSSQVDPATGHRLLKECACECHQNVKHDEGKDVKQTQEGKPS